MNKTLTVTGLLLLALTAGCGPLPGGKTQTAQVQSEKQAPTLTPKAMATAIQANLRAEMSHFSLAPASNTTALPPDVDYPSLQPNQTPFPQTKLGVQGGTAVPMQIAKVNAARYMMTIADSNTARPAYGRTLRLHDVHIAKMFETTAHLCPQLSLKAVQWDYKVAEKDRGTYTIPCALAAQIRKQYGTTNKPERTTIQGMGQLSIPVLKIADQKLHPWIVLVQQFHPQP